MPRRLPDGTDALSQAEMYGNTYIICRHRAGTLDDADKSIPLDLIHSSPVAVCSSSASATNKIATVDNYPDYSLVNGKEVVVYMQNGNSATNPTMNINNTGAIQMDFSDWSAGTFIKLKYIDITVGGQRIQKYLVDVGAYNNKQSVDSQINNALANYTKEYELITLNGNANYTLNNSFICKKNGIVFIKMEITVVASASSFNTLATFDKPINLIYIARTDTDGILIRVGDNGALQIAFGTVGTTYYINASYPIKKS
ncbi:MAG: hypothetical protein MJZ03_03350 [archaeon]|nr:hypothetical protein [archaeon]